MREELFQEAYKEMEVLEQANEELRCQLLSQQEKSDAVCAEHEQETVILIKQCNRPLQAKEQAEDQL
jgi:hypothetical protein